MRGRTIEPSKRIEFQEKAQVIGPTGVKLRNRKGSRMIQDKLCYWMKEKPIAHVPSSQAPEC